MKRIALLRSVLDRAGFAPRRLIKPLLLTACSQAVHMLQGLSFVTTVNAGRSRRRSLLGRTMLGRARFLGLGALSSSLLAEDMLLRSWRRKAWQRLARDLEHDLRARLFEHIQAQDLSFFGEHGTGPLSNLLEGDVDRIGAFIERALDQAMEKLVTVGVSSAVLLRASPLLSLTAFLPLPLMWGVTRGVARRAAAAHARSREQSDGLARLLDNALSRVVDIKSFAAEARESQRFHEQSRAFAQASLDLGAQRAAELNLAQGIFSFGFTLMASHGAALVARDDIELAQLTRALHTFPEIARVFGAISELANLYRGAAASAERLERVFATRPTIHSGTRPLDPAAVRGQLDFVDVGFSYNAGARVLDKITLSVAPGETLAIVGPTGSGKSTLLRLLLRLHDPDTGAILLDGTDIRELRIHDLRPAVGMVSQDAYLFRGSVRDNVCYGRQAAGDEDIVQALQTAHAWDFVRALPGGLDADVGEGGRKLSAGQRQRIAIARVLLARTPILALDEATSNLDYRTEALVYESLLEASRGRTKLVVAHRPNAIRSADRIIVLDRGTICEAGTHEALLRQGGLYTSLWLLQRDQARDEPEPARGAPRSPPR